MKSLAVFLVLVTLLSSCVTERACRAKFPPVVTRQDSIVERVEIRYVYRVVRDTVPGVKTTTYLPAGSKKPVSNKKNGLRATAIPTPDGGVKVECESDSLIREITVRDSVITTLRREISRVSEVQPDSVWTRLKNGFFLLGIACIIIVFIQVIIRIRK